ncbi:exo-rhamnogalacturonan lyase family protein [Horticoccus sp. 23ND18S-11]|uniref:exo-rhamnogalacturonan lyase family protein n=1 Tax=Horticoccus sp. 23ND18S-11 TaxID=3391832 RepID=UPI0039C8DD3E
MSRLPRSFLPCLIALVSGVGVRAAEIAPITLRWLGDAAPAAPNGVTWGVPWPKGAVTPSTPMRLTTADQQRLNVQTWPLAFWPDGSVKWTGHALAATAGLKGPFQLTPASASDVSAATATITYEEDTDGFTIDTGALKARIAKRRSRLIESLTVGGRVVARNGSLIARREDRSTPGAPRDIELRGGIERATLEQRGAVRAVIKLEGRHVEAGTNGRVWLPFTVRLAFFAGSGAIKLTHSFVFDGDGATDFIKGLGLSLEIPFQEELHNRHLRFAGDADGGIWTQPVRMLPGYRPSAGRAVVEHYAAHLAGQRVPNLADLDQRTRDNILTVPVWADAKLTQVGPNNWSLHKRTSAEASWLHVTDGRRSRGLAVLADVTGGLAVGVKDFWQKSAKSFEILHGNANHGELRVWLWSPEGGAMDLRRYDETPHGLSINYEDWKPGWGSPHGIANTHDLTLWAFDRIPSNEQLVAMAREAAEPPVLVCTPEYYHAQQAVGRWSLPDRSTPAFRWVEDQIETFVNYYRDQVDERSWYGFWDFGDIMHNYDFGRHEWRYDVGGWAWVNTELMPDMLLWYSFLRTGRADLFRFAEAMTRHTSEVDVHHVGPFAPLGSRHNVNHWGDGAKQPRVSHAGIKRHYYFLSGGDGRIGDLLREQLDADLTYAYLVQFNPSHYVPNADGSARLERPGSPVAPRPENFTARPTAADRQPSTRFGLEWMCYALNWTTEWERGGDQAWRGRLESDMKAMAANLDAQGRFPGRYFDMIFGGPENMWEMEPMYDIPEFWAAWTATCEAVGRQVEGGQMTGPRMLAYAAYKKNSAELGRMAWEKLMGPAGKLPPLNVPKRITGPDTLRTVTDPSFLGAPVGWQLHGVASVQWALNAIETLEFAKAWLPDWEGTR